MVRRYLASNVDKFSGRRSTTARTGASDDHIIPNIPQVYIEVDREKRFKQGVALKDIYNTLQAFLGGSFINYFNRFGRQWQVYVQAANTFRANAGTNRSILRSQC